MRTDINMDLLEYFRSTSNEYIMIKELEEVKVKSSIISILSIFKSVV